MLLTRSAAVWFQGVKKTLTTWEGTVKALRAAYGPAKPAHQIYRELFSKEQTNDQTTDVFVSYARVLFSQLTENPSEAIQLDMVYGLLNLRMRKRIML